MPSHSGLPIALAACSLGSTIFEMRLVCLSFLAHGSTDSVQISSHFHPFTFAELVALQSLAAGSCLIMLFCLPACLGGFLLWLSPVGAAFPVSVLCSSVVAFIHRHVACPVSSSRVFLHLIVQRLLPAQAQALDAVLVWPCPPVPFGFP